MKKIISFALSIVLVLCSIFASSAACNHAYEKTEVEATCVERAHVLNTCTSCGDSYKEYESVAEYPETTYFSVEGERDGDVLNVKVLYGNNPGVYSMRLSLFYNGKALKVSNIKNGDVWKNEPMYTSNETPASGSPYVRFLYENKGVEDIYNNGTIFTVSFEIKDVMEEWDISFVIENKKDLITHDGKTIAYEIVDSVTLGYGDHSYDEGEIIVAPTLESEGEIKYSCLYCSETKTEVLPMIKYIPGDADLNGKVDSRDCFVLKASLVGMVSQEAPFENLDFNCDGVFNAKDLLCMKKQFAEIE